LTQSATFPEQLTLTVFDWNQSALGSLRRVPGLQFAGVRRVRAMQAAITSSYYASVVWSIANSLLARTHWLASVLQGNLGGDLLQYSVPLVASGTCLSCLSVPAS
jgi:hypothetical protein